MSDNPYAVYGAPTQNSAPADNPYAKFTKAGPGLPQPSSPFGRVSVPELPAPTGDAVLENIKKPGQAYQQLLAHPRDPAAALNVLINSAPDAQIDANRSRNLNALGSYVGKPNLGQNPSGMTKAATDLWFDPTTFLGGMGGIEKVANAAGRTGYIAAAKGMNAANPVSRFAAGVHDFVTPGGAEMGKLKRTLGAQGRGGLDTYVQARSAAKGAANAGADQAAAVSAALSKPKYKPGSVPGKPQYIGSTPPPDFITDAFKPRQPMTGGGRPGEIARGISKGAKTLTRGATDLMFVAPQLPLMEGHGSNVLQTALLSDPLTTAGSLARFAASGEAIPFSKARDAFQKLPGVSGLKKAQDASIARAEATGASSVNPDFGNQGGWLEKIPGVGMAARESNRGLHMWDSAVKGSLSDKYTKDFLAQGYTPAVAKAKAADRVAQDVVDYSDTSDLTKAAKHVLPFATYATKKPGVIARAAIRHPERVLAMTRDNPNFDQERDQPMEGFDKGRPLSSIFNATNNRSPGSKGAAPYPGAQYQRASQGAAANALLGVANPYFTYGPPAKHADGNAALGWLKLLLSQTVGNATGGDQLLNATGMNYFGGK